MRIHIVTNAGTLSYRNYCVENHKKLAAHPEKLEFVSYCLDAQSYFQLTSEKETCAKELE